MRVALAVALAVVLLLNIGAAEVATTQPAGVATDTFPHPVLPKGGGSWVGVMMQVVGAMFVLAGVIGPMVRRHGARDLPVTHAHDEPPGSSGHHGRTGTVDLAPPDRH